MMKVQITSSVWLNDTDLCDIDHLSELSGLSIDEIEDLIENGLIAAEQVDQRRCFRLRHVVTVNTARRLRDDFQLDRNGVALAMTLLGRIKVLEDDLSALNARLGHVG